MHSALLTTEPRVMSSCCLSNDQNNEQNKIHKGTSTLRNNIFSPFEVCPGSPCPGVEVSHGLLELAGRGVVHPLSHTTSANTLPFLSPQQSHASLSLPGLARCKPSVLPITTPAARGTSSIDTGHCTATLLTPTHSPQLQPGKSLSRWDKATLDSELSCVFAARLAQVNLSR